MKSLASALLVGVVAFAAAPQARAHIDLVFPKSNTTDQKGDAPCGPRGPSMPTTFKPGETITVKWTETIPHPGHFRISFDPDGVDDFKDPTSFTDIKTPAVAPILADGVLKHTGGGGMREFQVTLPNMTCTKCTLQLLQIMTDKPPFGPGGGDDIYRRCADIVLAGAASGGDGGAPDAGGGKDAGGSGSGGRTGAGGAGGVTGGSGGSTGSGGSGGSPSGAGGSTSTGGGSPAGSGGGSAGSTGGGARGGAAGSSAPATPSNSDSGGCAVGGGAGGSAGWALMALLVGLALRFRRRR